jgi:hypothetical protein
MIKPGLWLRLGVIWLGALVFSASSIMVVSDFDKALRVAFIGFVTMGFGSISAFFWMLDHDGEEAPKRRD